MAVFECLKLSGPLVEIQCFCFLAEVLGGAVMTQAGRAWVAGPWGSSKLQRHRRPRVHRNSQPLRTRQQGLEWWISFLTGAYGHLQACLPAADLSHAMSVFSNQRADAICETRCC